VLGHAPVNRARHRSSKQAKTQAKVCCLLGARFATADINGRAVEQTNKSRSGDVMRAQHRARYQQDGCVDKIASCRDSIMMWGAGADDLQSAAAWEFLCACVAVCTVVVIECFMLREWLRVANLLMWGVGGE